MSDNKNDEVKNDKANVNGTTDSSHGNKIGRRAALALLALAGLGGYGLTRKLGGGKKRGGAAQMDDEPDDQAFGTKLILPEIDEQYAAILREPTFPNVFFSPDSSKIAVVAGDLTTKLVYAAPWRVQSPSDYKLVAQFDNCYKCDGVCFDGDDLICRVSSFTFNSESPRVTTAEEYQNAWNEALLIHDPSISLHELKHGHGADCASLEGALVRVRADGTVTKLCARPASVEMQSTTQIVKTSSSVVVCLERDFNELYRYDFSSAEPATDVESIAQIQGASAFVDLSYDTEQDAVYAHDRENIYRLDPAAPSSTRVLKAPSRKVRPNEPRPNDEQFVSFTQMSGANFFYHATLAKHMFWQKIPSGEKYSFAYPDAAMFAVSQVAPNGDVVFLQFVEHDRQIVSSALKFLEMSESTPQEA